MKYVLILLLLSGCVKTPTQNIIEHHVQLVDEVLKKPDLSDEAKEALKTCKAGLLSAEETYKTEIAKCNSDIRYWKAVSSFMMILILLYVGFRFMKR